VSTEFSISVVDDDDSFRLAIIGSLRSFGYAAQGFSSGEEFFAAQAAQLSNCVITDLHMPGMSGLDLIRQLQTRGSPVPAIMITGRPEPGLEAKATAAGALCLLRKPFETDALIQCLEKALKI
jgi:FixJ family two-component response regulator